MEDIENSGAIEPGSGVILNCEDERYIGFLQGTDDTYLYLKATHKWGEVTPEVTEESAAKLREILNARPLWMLRAQVAWRYRVVPLGLDRETALDMLTEWAKMEAIDREGPVETFLPQLKAVNMAVPHMNILSFESLQDVMGGRVLAGLDFKTTAEYNEEYGDDEEGSSGEHETSE
jgi:hypothetical protein